MRPENLFDALWPAPTAAPMTRAQRGRIEARPGRTPEQCSATLQLALPVATLSRQLGELLPLCRCLPGLRRIRPLPGGLTGAGDAGLYEADQGQGWLRIRAWRPGSRLWLTLVDEHRTLHLALRWRACAAGSRLEIDLQRIGAAAPPLHRQLDAFVANLALHLHDDLAQP